VYRWDGVVGTKYEFDKNFRFSNTNAFASDAAGNVYFGSADKSVVVINNDSVTEIKNELLGKEFALSAITVIDNSLYCAFKNWAPSKEIFLYSNREWNKLSTPEFDTISELSGAITNKLVIVEAVVSFYYLLNLSDGQLKKLNKIETHGGALVESDNKLIMYEGSYIQIFDSNAVEIYRITKNEWRNLFNERVKIEHISVADKKNLLVLFQEESSKKERRNYIYNFNLDRLSLEPHFYCDDISSKSNINKSFVDRAGNLWLSNYTSKDTTYFERVDKNHKRITIKNK
jgi:hypothetical protein